jgi:hypothetical protein
MGKDDQESKLSWASIHVLALHGTAGRLLGLVTFRAPLLQSDVFLYNSSLRFLPIVRVTRRLRFQFF